MMTFPTILLIGVIFSAESNSIVLTEEQLSERFDQIVEALTEDPAKNWRELEVLRESSENADDRELWADWNILAALLKMELGELAETGVAVQLD